MAAPVNITPTLTSFLFIARQSPRCRIPRRGFHFFACSSIIADLSARRSVAHRPRKRYLTTDRSPSHAAAEKSFAALRHPVFRAYFITSALAMMADSIEHVISYWMLWEKFHSQAL